MPMQNRKSRITEQVIFDVGACDKNLITSLCYYFVLYFLCIFAELFLLLSVETIANLSRESIVFICLGRPGSASYIHFLFYHWMPPSILQGPTHTHPHTLINNTWQVQVVTDVTRFGCPVRLMMLCWSHDMKWSVPCASSGSWCLWGAKTSLASWSYKVQVDSLEKRKF